MIHNLSLQQIVARVVPPDPWSEGDNIPWDDPAFSQRMLREHLSQDHDLASRRVPIVDAHVRWIHQNLLEGRPSHITDLGCGPGLYCHRLARLGHRCRGLDFSPASIDHAQSVAAAEELRCQFQLADLRHAELEGGQDLVLLVYGQLNVFRRSEAEDLLRRAHRALVNGGKLLLEVQSDDQVRSADGAIPTWHTADGGLFADGPHLVLHERFWDEQRRCSTERWHVIDAATGSVTRFALSNEAYTRDNLTDLLRATGFRAPEFSDVLPGSEPGSPMFAVQALK